MTRLLPRPWRTPPSPSRAITSLKAATATDAIGTGVFMAAGAVYLTQRVGLSATEVGLGLAIGGLCGALGLVPVGRSGDRFGAGKSLIVLQGWCALASAAFLLADSLTGFLVVACLVAVPEHGWRPLMVSLVTACSSGAERTHTLASIRVIRNVGFAVGGLIASGALWLGTAVAMDAIILVKALSFLASGVTLTLAGVGMLRSLPHDAQHRPSRVPLRQQVPYLRVAALDAVCCVHMSVLSVGIPLWVITATDLPTAAVAAVFVVNTLLAVAFQQRASRMIGARVPTATRAMAASLATLAATCLLLALLPSLSAAQAALVLGLTVVTLTLAELQQSAASWTLSLKLAPRDGESAIYAAFELGFSAQLVAGPLLVSAVAQSGRAAWAGLAAVVLAVTLFVPAAVRSAQRCAEAGSLPKPHTRQAPAPAEPAPSALEAR